MINDLCERKIIQLMKIDGSRLVEVNETTQTEKICIAACENDGYAVRFAFNQTPAVQMAAVRKHGKALRYIHNPSDNVATVAINRDSYAARYVNKPGENS